MSRINEADFEKDSSEASWAEWAGEFSMDFTMIAAAVGLAWFSTVQLWT